MSARLEGGVLSRKRTIRRCDNTGKKLNVDHIQSKLTERTGKVKPDLERFDTRKLAREAVDGERYFWAQRGMEPPAPMCAWDPFLSNSKNKETRALKKATT